MFPESPNGFSFLKIISGLSKSLNVAKQIIPIYEGAKPMVQNAQKAFSLLKNVNINSLVSKMNNVNNSKQIKKIDTSAKKTTLQKSSHTANPVFFK